MNELFESSVRSTGDFSAVFEFDGETSYFYLLSCVGGNNIIAALSIDCDPGDLDRGCSIVWSLDESRVGLVIGGELFGVFDLSGPHKIGGRPSGVVDGLPDYLIKELTRNIKKGTANNGSKFTS